MPKFTHTQTHTSYLQAQTRVRYNSDLKHTDIEERLWFDPEAELKTCCRNSSRRKRLCDYPSALISLTQNSVWSTGRHSHAVLALLGHIGESGLLTTRGNVCSIGLAMVGYGTIAAVPNMPTGLGKPDHWCGYTGVGIIPAKGVVGIRYPPRWSTGDGVLVMPWGMMGPRAADSGQDRGRWSFTAAGGIEPLI